MKSRIIQTKFWSDAFIDSLDWKAKYLFMFLLSNDKIGLTGAYEVTDREMSYFTGLSSDEVAKAKKDLKNKVLFPKLGWVVIKNALRYNNYARSETQKKAYIKEYNALPDEVKELVPQIALATQNESN